MNDNRLRLIAKLEQLQEYKDFIDERRDFGWIFDVIFVTKDEDPHDFDLWYSDTPLHECGSVGCALGYANLIFDKNPNDKFFEKDENTAQFFDLTTEEVRKTFYGEDYVYDDESYGNCDLDNYLNITPGMVAKRLRELP
jgi:hypothetical protein